MSSALADLDWYRDDDGVGSVAEPDLAGEGAVVVEDLLPPAAYHDFGDHDGDDGVGLVGDEVVDVVEDGSRQVSVRRLQDLQGDVAVVLCPCGADPVGVAVFEGDADGHDTVGSE